MTLPPPAPCTTCKPPVDGTPAPLITPTLGAVTKKRDLTTRDYPMAVFACPACGSVREEPIERRKADVPGMCDRRGGPAVV